MQKNELNLALKCFRNGSEKRRLGFQLKVFKSKLQNIVESINLKEEKYTGWYVLLKEVDKKWKSIGCYDPDLDDGESELNEADIILPIPEPDSLPEFDGF